MLSPFSSLRRRARVLQRLSASEAGFSLIESMVAITLTAVALVFFASSISNSVLAERTLSEHVRARTWAISQMELIKSVEYENPIAGYPLVSVDSGYTVAISGQYWNGSSWTGTLGAMITQSWEALDVGDDRLVVASEFQQLSQRLTVDVNKASTATITSNGTRFTLTVPYYTCSPANCSGTTLTKRTKTIRYTFASPNFTRKDSTESATATVARHVSAASFAITTSEFASTTATVNLTLSQAGFSESRSFQYTMEALQSPTLCAIDDAWVEEDDPNDNNGNPGNVTAPDGERYKPLDVQSGTGVRWWIFLKFDLTDIPAGSTINSATLQLMMDVAPTASRTYNVHRVIDSWSEGGVDWNDNDAVAATATASVATGTTNYQFLQWNVTADVAAFMAGTTNRGWRISDASSGATVYKAWFHSKDNNNVYVCPSLDIDYTEP